MELASGLMQKEMFGSRYSASDEVKSKIAHIIADRITVIIKE
jgi:hypothetical protein